MDNNGIRIEKILKHAGIGLWEIEILNQSVPVPRGDQRMKELLGIEG